MLPLILAAIGAAKGIEDQKQATADKYAEAQRDAAMIKWSPWSGIDPNKFANKTYATQSADSSALAGGAAGYQAADNIKNSGADSDYRKSVSDYYKSKTAAPAPASNPAGGANAQSAAAQNFYSPYAGLSVQGQPNLLQGQAIQDVPYGSGFGDA